ncbi:hypothetical protein DPMN_093266 [Dreissena polymorpha]|uniref:Uncharacterized protein n=1 Tax=Dreissena polymorpha TaxID=45954 RepID=A0A9D4L306_DREPO|nr:hypothetical protein DPMN_093266 [Dreissena polymorpha]
MPMESSTSSKKALATSVDPDETPHDEASYQGLRCLPIKEFLTKTYNGDASLLLKGYVRLEVLSLTTLVMSAANLPKIDIWV